MVNGNNFSCWKMGLALALTVALIAFDVNKGEANPLPNRIQDSDRRKPVDNSSVEKRPTPSSSFDSSPSFPSENKLNQTSSKQSQQGLSAFSQVKFNRPSLSPRGAPGKREGGGTRDDHNCPFLKSEERLTALVPAFKSEQLVDQVWGLTDEASPTLWFYVPYLPKDIKVGELEIWDETDRELNNYQQIYQGNFTITGTPGVIGLSLPATVKLEPNRQYHWYLSLNINCSVENESTNVNGWIQRIKFSNNLSTQQRLVTRNQVILYAQKGIWYDALNLLAQLRRSRPEAQILINDWQKLLGDVGLENFSVKAITSCCNLESHSTQARK